MVTKSCPNEGCDNSLTKSQFDSNVKSCQHTKNIDSQWSVQKNSNNNSFAVERMGATHVQKCQFAALGCKFVGDDTELINHMEKGVNSHLEYVCKVLLSNNQLSHKPIANGYVHTSEGNEAMKQLLFSDVEKMKAKVEQASKEGDKAKSQATEIQEKQNEIDFRLNGVEGLLATIQQALQKSIALMKKFLSLYKHFKPLPMMASTYGRYQISPDVEEML